MQHCRPLGPVAASLAIAVLILFRPQVIFAHDAPLPVWTNLVPTTGLRLQSRNELHVRDHKSSHPSTGRATAPAYIDNGAIGPRFQPILPSENSPMQLAGPQPALLSIYREQPVRIAATYIGPRVLLTECGGFGISYTLSNLQIDDSSCQGHIRHGPPDYRPCQILVDGQATVAPLAPDSHFQGQLNRSRLLSHRLAVEGPVEISGDDFRVLPLLNCRPVDLEITLVYGP